MARRKRGNRRLPPGLYSWKAKNGTTYWRMRTYVDGKRTFIQLGPLTREDALAAYYENQSDPARARSVSQSRTPNGWSDYASLVYLPYIRDNRAPKTLEVEKYAAGWLSLFFKNQDIGTIDTESVEAYKRWRRQHGGRRGKDGPPQKPRARTINLELACLNKALKYAVTLGVLKRAPTIVRLPEARERREPRWLTGEQMDELIEAATPARKLLLLFAFHTGMRPGEIASRTKADIDLERGICRVAPAPDFRVKRERPRVVPLTRTLWEALRKGWDDLPDEGPIFAGQSLKETLRRMCAKLNLPHLHAYGTRHSFISRWAAEGRSRDALIKIVGHSDGQMIDRVYAHFGTDELADHVARVGWGREATVVPIRSARGSGES